MLLNRHDTGALHYLSLLCQEERFSFLFFSLIFSFFLFLLFSFIFFYFSFFFSFFFIFFLSFFFGYNLDSFYTTKEVIIKQNKWNKVIPIICWTVLIDKHACLIRFCFIAKNIKRTLCVKEKYKNYQTIQQPRSVYYWFAIKQVYF